MKYKKLFLLTFLAITGSKVQTMDKALARATAAHIEAQNALLKQQADSYLGALDKAASMVATSDEMMEKFRCNGSACRDLAKARAEQAKLWDKAAKNTEKVLAKHGIKHRQAPKALPKAAAAPKLTSRPAKQSSSRPARYVKAPWER